MAKFRKIPVVVEARQFTSKMYDNLGGQELGIVWRHDEAHAYPVITAEATGETFDFKINSGDWIVFEDGKPSYPVHRKEFEREYEPVKEG